MTTQAAVTPEQGPHACSARAVVGGVDGEPGQHQRHRSDDDNGRALPDGTTVPNEAIEAPASVPVPGVIAPAVPEGSADSVVSGASSNGIPAPAIAAYQRGAQIIDAADKSCNIPWELIAGHRPGRVRPRPLRRQHPDRERRQQARHLRHRAQRQERHPGHQRHRRWPAGQGHRLRPRRGSDAVHPLDLAGRQGRRRRRQQAQPPGHRRRCARHRRLPVLGQGQPLPRARARKPRSTATTTARTT